WEVDEAAPIGKPGGFGSVFAGKAADGSLVAVKILRPDIGDAGHRELEFAQAFAGRATRHIVPILDFGVDANSGRSCIVMARAKESLRDAIARSELDQGGAINIIRDVANGLVEAGDWIHR